MTAASQEARAHRRTVARANDRAGRVRRRLFTGLIIAVAGGGFALAGWSGMADVEPPDGGISTTAAVLGSVEGTALIDGIAVPNFSPVYEYEDIAGDIHRVTDHISADSRPLAVGSTVEVSYLLGEPDSVRRTDVDNDWLHWFVVGGGLTAAIGATVVLISAVGGLFAMVSARRMVSSITRCLDAGR